MTGFIDKDNVYQGQFSPKLLMNTAQENVLEHIKQQLETCESFIISVAFVTEAGLTSLKSIFYDLNSRGIKGKLITSDYLGFNHPKVFTELLKISNLEVRVFPEEGFHAKGYIFKKENHYSITIGSSNLTSNALQKNYEWNLQFTSHYNGDIVAQVMDAVEQQWEQSLPLSYEWIDTYSVVFNALSEARKRSTTIQLKQQNGIEPNRMQKEALLALSDLRSTGANRGLVISATGTGKTFLSAFDVKQFQPRNLLFIVHREQILQKAMADYKQILGGADSDYGVLSGSIQNTEVKYLFATIQTLSKETRLNSFGKQAFDYILIDESHKVGGESYQRVIEYFQPEFLLGMTATPERTDSFNVYELFDYNIAYEIRLQGAMEAEMLCPFQYFGVIDYEREGEIIDDHSQLDKLISTERVSHLLEKVEYYGYSGEVLRGLIFCSRKDEATQIAKELSERGYKSIALTGDDTIKVRESAVRQLEEGEIQYIVTVDIFNEGIDIPSVNQVVMLRQTQSSIIFVQQLGRGLRKNSTKEYVTIIDFIGNYKNNYLIPIALTGDTSKNKDTIRNKMSKINQIAGISTINFEEIAKTRIFESINAVKLDSMVALKEEYFSLKQQLGRQPWLLDFILNDSVDPEILVKNKKTYPEFLLAIKETTENLSDSQTAFLQFISLELLNGKRQHELLLLKKLISGPIKKTAFIEWLSLNELLVDLKTLESVEDVLTLDFFVTASQERYGNVPLLTKSNDEYNLSSILKLDLGQSLYFKTAFIDALDAGIERAKRYQNNRALTIEEKYSRKDACRLLNWDKDESATLYGYKPKYGNCPIFFTYEKDESLDASVAYEDDFLNAKVLKWYTRSNRSLTSKEVIKIVQSNETRMPIHVFVKKSDGEGSDSYYLGTAKVDNNTVQQVTMRDGKPVVEMNLILDNEVEKSLFHYLMSSSNT